MIHTDFEKGFIRAEVIKYDDYIKYGSEAAVREAGKLGIEGKEYVVQDGDIINVGGYKVAPDEVEEIGRAHV